MGKLIDNLKTRFSLNAGTGKLPSPVPPKPPNKQTALPGYRTQATASTSAVPRKDRSLTNTDILSFRQGRSTYEIIRNLGAASPDLSAVVNAYLRVGIPEKFTLIGRDMDGAVNAEATQLAHEILRRLTFVPDYELGFNTYSSLQTLSESLAKEAIFTGALAMEVSLNKARLPSQWVPIAIGSLKFYEEDMGLRPVQVVGGAEIDLDIPTFFYIPIDQALTDAYSVSLMEAAIQPILADSEFTNDLRRVLKRAIQPRVIATIIDEKVKASVSPEILHDPEALAAFYNQLIAGIEETLSGLEPEDALIGFDMIEYSHMEGQDSGIGEQLKAVQEMLNAKLTTGARALPAVLGHGKSNTSTSSESMLFVKSADVIRRKLNEMYSRALTLCVRLYGVDAYVEFNYHQIDLRPDAELEAYKSMEQSRVLELLSLGLIPDEEASLVLTGHLPPAGFKPLSGTMFTVNKVTSENPDSQTSNMNKESKPSTPASPKSPKKA